MALCHYGLFSLSSCLRLKCSLYINDFCVCLIKIKTNLIRANYITLIYDCLSDSSKENSVPDDMNLSHQEPLVPVSPTRKRKRSESPDLSRRAKRVSVEPSNESVSKPVKKRSIFTSVASMAETSVKPKTDTLSGVYHPKSMYGSYCWDALPSPNPCINTAFWNSPLTLQGRGVTPTISMSSRPGISDQSSLDLRMRSRDLGCSPVLPTQHKSNPRIAQHNETSFTPDCTTHATGTTTFSSPPHTTGTTTCFSPLTSRFPPSSGMGRILSDSTHRHNIPHRHGLTDSNPSLSDNLLDDKHSLSSSLTNHVQFNSLPHNLSFNGNNSPPSVLTQYQPHIQKPQVRYEKLYIILRQLANESLYIRSRGHPH